MRKQPTKPGFVCPHTARVAVLVRDYSSRPLMRRGWEIKRILAAKTLDDGLRFS